MSRLGDYLKRRREKLGISKAEFCRRMPDDSRIHPDTLGKIEKGDIKRPPDKRLEGFSVVLKVPVTILRQLLLMVMVTVTMGKVLAMLNTIVNSTVTDAGDTIEAIADDIIKTYKLK